MIEVGKDSVNIRLNPGLYDLEAIYSAAYVFLDTAYVMLDKDNKHIIVTLKPKNKADLDALGGEFVNELINYSDYLKRSEKTRKIRETLLQRALLTHGEDYKEDPHGVMKAWEDDKQLQDKKD